MADVEADSIDGSSRMAVEADSIKADSIDWLLRAKLYQRFHHMTDAFRACDRDKDGVIDVKDFAEVVTNLGFARVTRSTVEELTRKYDKNDDGLVTYAEFCATIEGSAMNAEPTRETTSRADKVEEAVRQHVLAAHSSLQQAFLKLDRDRSAHISPGELERVLRGAGVAVSAEEMEALVRKYDTGGDGRLDVSELGRLLEGGPNSAQYPGHTNQRTVLSPRKPAKRART